MVEIDGFIRQIEGFPHPAERPLVTLAFAQSLDGCIAAERGRSLVLSGPESLRITHQIRAAHDAILVGIGTVLADNPSLTVRLVAGENPQPVVLDPNLRMPLSANLLQDPARAAWIFASPLAKVERIEALKTRGARVFCMPVEERGWIELAEMLRLLASLGIKRLMVEGGARVLTSFVNSGLADLAVITVAPSFVGGLRAYEEPAREGRQLPQLDLAGSQQVGRDWVLWGEFARG